MPYPPTVNTYWRKAGKGFRISDSGQTYIREVKRYIHDNFPGMEPKKGKLAVAVYAWRPDHRQRDIDNIAKSLLDALTKAGVYVDDDQVYKLTMHKKPVMRGGSVGVVITPHKPDPMRFVYFLPRNIQRLLGVFTP